MAMQWRSAGDMPAEGNLVLVRLRPDVVCGHVWPEREPMLVAAYVRAGFYCYANNGAIIQGTLIICGWVPMADALAALGDETNKNGCVPDMPNMPPPPPRKIGTGAEALAMEMAAQDPDEPCRVRRVFDGKYLAWDDTGGRGTYTFDAESVWPRSRATVIANAMIVLTGEHDIEVEPVEG